MRAPTDGCTHLLVELAAVCDSKAAHATSQWMNASAKVAVGALRECRRFFSHHDLAAPDVVRERPAIPVSESMRGVRH
eukprot:scaffold19505_cov33-Tisochrysis_lutea.AAC.2